MRDSKDSLQHLLPEDQSHKPRDYQVDIANLKIQKLKVFKNKLYTIHSLKINCFPYTQSYSSFQISRYQEEVEGATLSFQWS